MLDGWYCRSMANMQAEDRARSSQQNEDEYSSDSSQSEAEPEVNYKAQYWTLKKKLKYLIYENECFQDALRSTQKRLIKASRDRSFLLDRLLQYEKPENTSSESDETESSDDPDSNRVEQGKRKRMDTNTSQNAVPPAPVASKNQAAVKRKRPPANKKAQQNNVQSHHMMAMPKANSTLGISMAAANAGAGDGHMTPEEVERHLQSRQSYLELLPERAPPTVPTEMFSNDPSLDSESNDILENSPNIGDEWIE